MCHIFLPSNSTSSYSPAGGTMEQEVSGGDRWQRGGPALQSWPPGTPGNLDREERAHAHLVSPISKLLKGWQGGPAGKALAEEA